MMTNILFLVQVLTTAFFIFFYKCDVQIYTIFLNVNTP